VRAHVVGVQVGEAHIFQDAPRCPVDMPHRVPATHCVHGHSEGHGESISGFSLLERTSETCSRGCHPIRERQREGIAIAKAAGVYKGRVRKFDAATAELIRGRMRAGENVSAIAREFSVSRPTIYRAVGA
jgi:hypothetical protein